MKLNVKAFALTVGLLWSVSLFLMTWWLIALDGSTGEKLIIGKFYIGYSVSALGSIIGFLWALPDGMIAGALFAWLYNRLNRGEDVCRSGEAT